MLRLPTHVLPTCLLCLLTACASPERGEPAAVTPAAATLAAPAALAPDFALHDAAGREHRLSDYRGDVVLLDFWATWCNPCISASPMVQGLHMKYAPQGLRVFGIAVRDHGDPATYMRDHAYTYGLLMDGAPVADAWEVNAIPTFVVIDRHGAVVERVTGFGGDTHARLVSAIEGSL